ncbi:HTH-type transcriptional regulator SutR [Roseobacter fucihabitans]|uniref:HTH-type transcriptional regulator SutR n=1 Tax=Roseobacter fucihabitans TaxID=1537242 RepID=A0ABZ2C1L7_9RHOB|nr:XRE family transcriptional regulator [Roseobacter litoralis]MBC6967573.1 anaerobic benzoate catabolism transcriptional regulator [Roseobacter litoralis]
MTEADTDILTQLPARLKEARRSQGLSLDAVAKLSGVSRSMVSQIERGESSPTIATLWNLTRALQVDFAGLLDGAPKAAQIETLRAAEVPTIDNLGSGCRIRILSPPEEAGKHEVYELSIAQGGLLDSQPHARGAREHLTVISGRLTIMSGDVSTSLETGDTARYAADVPHRITAEGGEVRAFLVVQDA